MYEPHEDLSVPTDDARIWRYIDMAKFVSLLTTGTLFFCRLDKLRDPHEGVPNALALDLACRQSDGALVKGRQESPVKELQEFLMMCRRWTYVNSWHINQFESAAMWDVYAHNSQGIALETSFVRLRDSFSAESTEGVLIGKVIYIDYETAFVPLGNSLFPAVHKRVSFAHEQELRALVCLLFHRDLPEKTAVSPEGLTVRVNIVQMIRNVFVPPSAGSWYVEAIRAMLEKFGYRTIPVVQSLLYTLK